jgi:hypothetical protein
MNIRPGSPPGVNEPGISDGGLIQNEPCQRNA